MKRKMIGFLTMTLAVSAVGTLGSCKDYDDDNRVELQGEYAKLDKDLQNWIENVKKCQEQCKAFREYLVGNTQWCDEKGNPILIDRLGKLDGQLSLLDSYVRTLESTLDGKLDKKLDADALDGILEAALEGKLDADALDGILEGKLEGLETTFGNQLEGLQSTLQQQIEGLQVQMGDKFNQEEFNALLLRVTEVEKIKDNVGTLMEIIGTMDAEDFQNMQTDIIELQNAINGVEGAGGIKSQITDIQNQLDMLKNMQGVDETKVQQMIDANNLLIDTKILTAVNELSSNLLGEGCDTLTLNGINYALTAADTKLQGQIDAINTKMADFEEQLKTLSTNFKQLVTSVIVQGTYNPIFGSLTAPFNVQSNVLAAYYGYAEVPGSFPFTTAAMKVKDGDQFTEGDINMLQGTVKGAFDFSDGELLTDGNAGTIYLTINPTAIDFTGLDFTLENSVGEESPVKLGMLTPSKKKLTFGWTRGISTASTNGFYEAQAKIADEDIQKAKLVVDLTKNDVKEIFKDVTSPKDGIDIKKIANTVYSVVNDICDANAVKAYWGTDANANSTLSQYSIAATAVKPLSFAFMKDFHKDTFWGVDQVKNFINNTINRVNLHINIGGDLVVPTIKEINIPEYKYNEEYVIEFVYDKHIHVDGVNYTYELGKVFDKVIPVTIKDEADNVVGTDEINLKDYITADDIEVKVDPVDEDIHVVFKEDLNEMIEDLYGDITAPLDEVNGLLNDLQGFMDDVQSMLDEINGINNQIDQAKDDIKSQIYDYIDKLNKRLCNVVNGIHDRLQPLAIAHNGKEFYTLSGVPNKPSKISDTTLHIVPTTYTAELAVPVFKKHVAVVNVFKGSASAQGGDAACLNALKAANNKGGMNTVVAGTTRDVEFVGEKGYTYEIAYSALDYSGKAVTKKYYVTVE